MKKTLILIFSLAVATTSLQAAVVLSDDFSGGQGDWATRGVAGNILFQNEELNISPNVNNGQPGSAYHDFNTVTLADGQTLRLTVDVSMTNVATAKDRDVRIALGFADPAISGNSTVLGVPLSGYINTLPSTGSTVDPRVFWIDNSLFTGEVVNFFNSSTAAIGDPSLDNTKWVTDSPETWVYEITRSGSDLVFSGSFAGTAFGSTVVATGANVIDNFQFNTVGLAYAYASGFTATYDNLTIEVVPEPATFGLYAGIAVLGLIWIRRKRRA